MSAHFNEFWQSNQHTNCDAGHVCHPGCHPPYGLFPTLTLQLLLCFISLIFICRDHIICTLLYGRLLVQQKAVRLINVSGAEIVTAF